LLALAVHPENPEGESGVYGGLGFFRADAENGEGGLALAENGAGIDRAAGVFEIGAVADGFEFEAGKFARQGAFEDLFVAAADGTEGGGAALVAVGGDFEDGGLGLTEAQDA
jgi:hypothetical protein